MRIIKICGIAILLAATGCASTDGARQNQDANSEVNGKLDLTEKNGALLFREFESPTVSISPSVIAAAKQKVDGFCKLKYRALQLPNAPESIYFLAEQPPGYVAHGRHFRVVNNLVSSSTKSCLVLRKEVPDGAELTSMYVTHILSNYPTEFHVFVSLVQRLTLYVATQRGTYKIDSGKISFLGK